MFDARDSRQNPPPVGQDGSGSGAFEDEHADAPRGAHPGWSHQPQERYDAADSGGWGGPGGVPTGPLPRLRRDSPAPSHSSTPGHARAARPSGPPTERFGTPGTDPSPGSRHPFDDVETSGEGAEIAAALDSTRRPTPTTDRVADEASAPPDTTTPPRVGTPAARPAPTVGLGALFDLSFTARATRSLAPIAYVLVVLYLAIDLVGGVYAYSSSAANFGPGMLAGVFVLIAVGLFRIVALTVVTRFALEACLHLAELAAKRDTRP